MVLDTVLLRTFNKLCSSVVYIGVGIQGISQAYLYTAYYREVLHGKHTENMTEDT